MEKLTVEQKAKAYDEALKRARIEYKNEQSKGNIWDCESLSTIFPELKESEDERTRKYLISFVKINSGVNLPPEDAEQILAWLEKQGETYTKKDVDNAYLEGMAFAKDELEKQNKQILANSAKTCKDEQKPTDEEMKELLRTEYEKGRADAIAEMQKPVDCIDCTNSKGCINCKNGNMKETLVQTAWSEEDEHRIKDIIYFLETAKKHYASTVELDACIDWLKALRPQNKYDYNPYKAVVESIAEMCKHYDKASHSGLRDFYDNVKVKCKDAKEYDNIYSHNTWKPSDEQLEALKNAIHLKPFENPSDNFLWRLYEQLKKL